MPLNRLITRWSASGDAERANKDSFLNELCDVLGVERPYPKTGDPERDLYVFEKDVARTRAGGTSIGRVDLYKHGCFLLEAEQGAATGPKRRDSPAWNQIMSAAHGQSTARRFGLITTNSITQTFSRGILERALREEHASIVFAIPDHPWVDSADGAAVRVAMTVAGPGVVPGRLLTVAEETEGPDDRRSVIFEERFGLIHADLSTGANVSSAETLRANSGLSFMGVTLIGDGFRLDRAELAQLGIDPGHLPPTIRPYLNGKDLMQAGAERYVIDFFGLDEEAARQAMPSGFQRLMERVRPERQQNQRQAYRDKWWVFGEPRSKMRQALSGLNRFIVTIETSKHRPFVFLPSAFCPDHKLYGIATEDAWILGVLSSQAHLVWALAAGGRIGYGNDPTWTNSTCFLPFPFPVCTEAQKQRIRALGEALDAHRKRQQAQHPKLTITGMYNVLEKLRNGEPLTDKERVIHEQGLVSVLKQIHDDLDAAVFDAYGWPSTLTDEEILERLVALNHERAEEEKRGLVRWLRPEFQNPQGTKTATQVSLVEAGLETAAPAKAIRSKKAAKLAWPKELPARVVAVRDLLAELGEATADDVPRRFKGVQADQAEKLLESLAAVGVAIETTAGSGARRTWGLLR